MSRQAFGTGHCHWYQMTDRKKTQDDCNISEGFMSANICIELYKLIKQCSVVLMIILIMQHSFQLQTKSPTPLFPLALLTPCEKALAREEKSAQIQNTSRYRSLPSRRRADVCFLSARAPPNPPRGREDRRSRQPRRAWHTLPPAAAELVFRDGTHFIPDGKLLRTDRWRQSAV